jgi:hypothetical protein
MRFHNPVLVVMTLHVFHATTFLVESLAMNLDLVLMDVSCSFRYSLIVSYKTEALSDSSGYKLVIVCPHSVQRLVVSLPSEIRIHANEKNYNTKKHMNVKNYTNSNKNNRLTVNSVPYI